MSDKIIEEQKQIPEKKLWSMHWVETDEKKNRNKKLEEMCSYYINKYGMKPLFVYVPEKEFIENEEFVKLSFGNVGIKTNKQCLKNTYWVTNEEKLTETKK